MLWQSVTIGSGSKQTLKKSTRGRGGGREEEVEVEEDNEGVDIFLIVKIVKMLMILKIFSISLN